MSRESNTALLERIVADQRKIIAEETHKPADQTPQLWALYKEVQEYYDQGMRVPDDVTLLLCDDNWGNLRKLPKLGDKPRRGGYGIYYDRNRYGNALSERANLQWTTYTFRFSETGLPQGGNPTIAWNPRYLTREGLQEVLRSGAAPRPTGRCSSRWRSATRS